MTLNTNEEIINLPDDWWENAEVCQKFASLFIKHVLPLYFSVIIDGNRKDYSFSGFLMIYSGRLFWCSAGHVIENIDQIICSKNVQINQMRWLDRFQVPGADSLIVHNRKFSRYFIFDDELDFGIIEIAGMDKAHLENNQQVFPVTEIIWKNISTVTPAGFYIVGYPDEWKSTSLTNLSKEKTQVAISVSLACVPITRLSTSQFVKYPFISDHDDFFYGKLSDSFEDKSFPQKLKGMSGGPVLSIERTESGKIKYRLYGILSSWFPQQKIIKAIPIERVIKQIDFWLEQKTESLNEGE
jgi:hypothetical protein